MALATAGGLVLAACGASDTTSGGASPPVPGTCTSIGGLSGPVDDHGTASVSSGSVTLAAADFYFLPTCAARVPAGAVSVTVRNTGRALHNISVTDQGIDTDIASGQTVTVQVAVGNRPVAFVCKYHRSSGMQGALVPEIT